MFHFATEFRITETHLEASKSSPITQSLERTAEPNFFWTSLELNNAFTLCFLISGAIHAGMCAAEPTAGLTCKRDVKATQPVG
jgi:hypothetical protein